MTFDEIDDAVADLRTRHRLRVDPTVRGPVPLNGFYEAASLTHTAIHDLSCAKAIEYLVAERYFSSPDALGDFPRSVEPLEGLLFFSGAGGLAFVKADDILPRRRFTAAHELGHAVLHRDRMGRYRADAKIADADDGPDDEIEREANRFAAVLLMPEEVIRSRAAELKREHGCCPRVVLAHRLASELLVSREAMRYRLKGLEAGDE